MVTPFAHTLLPESRDDKGIVTKGIAIGPWTLTTIKGRIFDSGEMGRLNDINVPFPEMFFGYNRLELAHSSNGLKLTFNAHEALSMVHDTTCDEEDLVQVSYSHHWKKSRYSPIVNSFVLELLLK